MENRYLMSSQPLFYKDGHYINIFKAGPDGVEIVKFSKKKKKILKRKKSNFGVIPIIRKIHKPEIIVRNGATCVLYKKRYYRVHEDIWGYNYINKRNIEKNKIEIIYINVSDFEKIFYTL